MHTALHCSSVIEMPPWPTALQAASAHACLLFDCLPCVALACCAVLCCDACFRRYIKITQKMYLDKGAVPPPMESIRAYYWRMRAQLEGKTLS